jgi:MinD-like ATPase involved in chromosome partitioning or flagellar assembly
MTTSLADFRRGVSARGVASRRGAAYRTIVIASATQEAGGSTIAALLALSCANDGHRTLLIDRDPAVPTCTLLLGGAARDALGTRSAQDAIAITERLSLRVSGSAAVRHVGLHDLVIVDAGSRLESIRVPAPDADRIVVIAGPQSSALMSAYALVKTIEIRWSGVPVDIVLNQYDPAVAQRVMPTLHLASERFLHRDICYAGSIPADDELRDRALAQETLTLDTHAGLATRLVADQLLAALTGDSRVPSARRLTNWRH